eukprot:765110-Hanusia_phi.AAC.4
MAYRLAVGQQPHAPAGGGDHLPGPRGAGAGGQGKRELRPVRSEGPQVLHSATTLEIVSMQVQVYLRMSRVDIAEKSLRCERFAIPLLTPRSLMSRMEDDATLTQLSTVTATDPLPPSCRVVQAWVYTALGGEKVQEAFYIFQELADKYNETPLLLNGMAVTQMHLGKFEEADKYLLKALSKSATDQQTLQVWLISCPVLADLLSSSFATSEPRSVFPAHAQSAGSCVKVHQHALQGSSWLRPTQATSGGRSYVRQSGSLLQGLSCLKLPQLARLHLPSFSEAHSPHRLLVCLFETLAGPGAAAPRHAVDRDKRRDDTDAMGHERQRETGHLRGESPHKGVALAQEEEVDEHAVCDETGVQGASLHPVLDEPRGVEHASVELLMYHRHAMSLQPPPRLLHHLLVVRR